MADFKTNRAVHDVHDSNTAVRRSNRKTVSGRLVLAIFSAVMGSVVFGYNSGVINAPEQHIKAFINITYLDRTGEEMDERSITTLFALIVAIFPVGGMIGGFSAAWWADFFGRKMGMIHTNIIGIGSCALVYWSRTADSYEMLIVARFLVGISSGLFTGLTPMYLSEISTVKIRGALGTLHQLGVVSGLLLSQVLGFPEIFGDQSHWNMLLGLGVIPCVLQLFTMPVCPESPRYLLLQKQRETDAIQALTVLRGTADVYDEIDDIKSEGKLMNAQEKVGIIRLFKKRSLRRSLVISIAMQLSQQFSGINAIFYYSVILYKTAGLDKNTAVHATSGVGAIMVTMTMITIPLMDRVGRRTLHLIGLGGMFIFSILITLSLSLMYLSDWLKIGTIVVSLLYVVFFAVGPGSVPWLIVAEIFRQSERSAAIGVSVLVNWLANFIVAYTFPYIQDGLGNYSFVPFTVLLALFWLFTLKFVPETKNKTIEEITVELKKETSGTSASDPEAYVVT